MMSPDLQRILRIHDYCWKFRKPSHDMETIFKFLTAMEIIREALLFLSYRLESLAVPFLRHIGKKPAIVSSGALLRGCAIWSPIAMEA